MRLLDASALLALLLNEVGADLVRDMLPDVAISAVNLAEVEAKLIDHGVPATEVEGLVAKLELRVEDLTGSLALETAVLREATRLLGLSLGDRACLATAKHLGATAVTADRAWAKIAKPVGVEIELIR